jgi:hypothetical protein
VTVFRVTKVRRLGHPVTVFLKVYRPHVLGHPSDAGVVELFGVQDARADPAKAFQPLAEGKHRSS